VPTSEMGLFCKRSRKGPSSCLSAAHPATQVIVFCIPPSYNGIVDPSGELPGPGAVALPGTAKFIP